MVPLSLPHSSPEVESKAFALPAARWHDHQWALGLLIGSGRDGTALGTAALLKARASGFDQGLKRINLIQPILGDLWGQRKAVM